jgi:uncharacterized protein
MSAPVYSDDFQDGEDAYDRGDFQTAFEKWKPLAEKGDLGAQYNLGGIYFQGLGVAQDFKKARKWLMLSAEQGDDRAMYNLGVIYLQGAGITKNPEKAFSLFESSAKKGNVKAQNALGEMFAFGDGITKNFVQAFKWWSIAYVNGDKGVLRNLNIAKKRLNRVQIAEAQKLAREWVEEHRKE